MTLYLVKFRIVHETIYKGSKLVEADSVFEAEDDVRREYDAAELEPYCDPMPDVHEDLMIDDANTTME